MGIEEKIRREDGRRNRHLNEIIFQKGLLIGIFLFCFQELSAQQIRLHFPHFAGQAYDWVLIQGDKSDTIVRSEIPGDGWVSLDVPDRYAHYAGMSRWMLRSGGGLDFVINGEHFIVECLSDKPNESNIVFRDSKENLFLNQNFREQEKILAKFEAIQLGLRAYSPEEGLYATFSKEQQKLEASYSDFQKALAKNQLYAARFREIVNFTRGIGTTLDSDEKNQAYHADVFLRERLSWPALYTSNHWGGVIYSWTQMHLRVIQSDSALLGSATQILQRIPEPNMYTDFCDKMARQLVKSGKDSLIALLGPIVRQSGKLLHYNGILAQYQSLQAGELAPALSLSDNQGNAWSYTLEADSSEKRNKHLLVFYQSDCSHCEQALAELVQVYPDLSAQGVRVLALSADLQQSLFHEKAAEFPWKDSFCDGKGFSSPNFKQYGVAGTPTLFLVNANGRILLRTSRVAEVSAYLNN